MGLPSDYDNPQGMADAEEAIRQAIADLFLSMAVDYGYTSEHVQILFRAPDNKEDWETIASIEDPDSSNEDAENRRKLERHFYIDQKSMVWRLKELTIQYGLHIFMGFKDEYASAPAGRRSIADLYALNMKFGKLLADNQELGLDDRVSHLLLQMPSKPRWVPSDVQGSAVTVLDDTLTVVLKVC